MKKIYHIIPVPKPRMTQRDKWKNRPCVLRYFKFKDEIKAHKVTLPKCNYHVFFILPMPKSWSEKKKFDMYGKPHQQKPDKDNLEKALLDAIFKDDSQIWDGRVTKLWGIEGCIIIKLIQEKLCEKN